ncbi:sugar phosphate isomerase/epimerase family protein [Paenibacillus piri]|uniref:Sugar phosphate isomerase/epimerase n=1 Tax=Paenibacillus piri TaxID=2547395 RepID=A0A4R5KWE0_9BACL|nr:sugar phosphate isomerase/epimerase family protein [Paenibacillus piri]TDF99842.1 sugar phosphate isomerase/epimerase [Paenibacillus piri]
MGYKYIELDCWHPSDLTPRVILNLKRRCAESGLVPIAVYGSSFGGNNNNEISKDVCHKLRMIDAARELGCHRIVATGSRRGQAGGLEAIIAVLKQIMPYAEEQGVLVCLENHTNNNLEFIEDYTSVFTVIDSPNIGVCVDTGHFEASNIELDEVIDKLHSKINHIHVKETIEKGIESFVRFGQGVTDNNTFIEKMIELRYKGYITVELAIEDKSNLIEDLTKPYLMFNRYQQQ